ncbi:hypothetical protein IEQ34_000431 [Dendrobium chrysotoxum]|uniref:Uncharacterized protein n=1 Tax=Dendrobium chrysotoxum TaxID=161865 RepID=A0AAV7HSX0_DENCH|nr:hypothetical protein IEQ34_000431 [Dendrobium chrysotoxum]
MRDIVHSYDDLIHHVEAQISVDESINAHRKYCGHITKAYIQLKDENLETCSTRIGMVRENQQKAQYHYLRKAQPCPSVTLSIEDFNLRNKDIL